MKKFRYIIVGKLTLAVAAVTATALAVSAVLAANALPLPVAASSRLLPIYCTTQKDKLASLSFDAAWGNEDTQQLIDILGKYKVSATFFVVGEWVSKFPESVKALADAGHEIQNHSDTHPHMPQLSAEKMVEQIKACSDRIEKITGSRPTLFRAPYGDYDNTLIQTLKGQGMHCIQWDVDSLDWKDKTAQQIAERVVNKVQPGSICLFHNAAKNTPEALPTLIEQLQAKGYKLIPISKLIYTGEYTLDHAGRQVPSPTTQPESPKKATVKSPMQSETIAKSE